MKTYYNGQRSRRQEGTPPGTQGEQLSANEVASRNNKLTQLKNEALIAREKGTEKEFQERHGKSATEVLNTPFLLKPRVPDQRRAPGVRRRAPRGTDA